jgi:guanylate kinase
MTDATGKDRCRQGKIIVFSAPSGAGKTTILNYLLQNIPNLQYSISATTRKPRKGEIDGKHYFFLTEEEFKKRIEEKAFAEWALVHDNYYGSPRSYIDSTTAKGTNIIMDIDVVGKKKFDAVYPDATGILILPPGVDELERRLRGRGSDSEETIKTRLKNAVIEMEFAQTQGKYEYTIINDDLEKAKREAVQAVTSVLNTR